jgi:hypothetical protein
MQASEASKSEDHHTESTEEDYDLVLQEIV